MLKRLISYLFSSQLSQMSEDLSALRDQHNTDIRNLQSNLTSLTKEKDELQNMLKRTREEGEQLRRDLQKSEETVSLLIISMAHHGHFSLRCSQP